MYTPVPGGPTQDLSGNEFNETPRLQASLGGSYELPVTVGYVRASADYAWQSKVEFNVINDFNYQGAYGTLNARLALAGRSRDWEVAVSGTNLTDKRFAYNGGTITEPLVATPTVAWQIPGAPRMYWVEGTYRWGATR